MYCKFCGSDVAEDAVICPFCGRQIGEIKYSSYFIDTTKEEMPADMQGWNWGAFWLDWIWGIGNKTWIMLLGLAFPFIMGIIGGINGHKWAWENGEWRSANHFRINQLQWSKWAFIVKGASLMLIGLIYFTFIIIPGSDFIWILGLLFLIIGGLLLIPGFNYDKKIKKLQQEAER